MADTTFNDQPLVMGYLISPLVGRWHGEIYAATLDAAIAVGQQATLSILGTTRVGTVISAGSEAGYVRALVVGGAGKLGTALTARDYRGYTAGAIAQDCLRDAGEVAGTGWENLSTNCPHWTRPVDTCRGSLRRLVRLAGAGQHWRVAPDGTIVLRTEDWSDNTLAVDRDGFIWPQENLVQFWPYDGSADVGQSVTTYGAARRLERVEYRWSAEETTCRGWYQ